MTVTCSIFPYILLCTNFLYYNCNNIGWVVPCINLIDIKPLKSDLQSRPLEFELFMTWQIAKMMLQICSLDFDAYKYVRQLCSINSIVYMYVIALYISSIALIFIYFDQNVTSLKTLYQMNLFFLNALISMLNYK